MTKETLTRAENALHRAFGQKIDATCDDPRLSTDQRRTETNEARKDLEALKEIRAELEAMKE